MAKTRSFGIEVYIDGVIVGGLTDVNISSGDVTNVDTTCHNTEDGFRTFVAGLKDGGSVELSGKYNYADAGQDDWREAMGDVRPIYIIMPDKSGFAMNVIVGSFNATAPLDDAAEFTASAKITGEVFPVYPTITVTGTLTSNGSTAVTFSPLVFAGFDAGKPMYSDTGSTVTFDYTARWSIGTMKFFLRAGVTEWRSSVTSALTCDSATGYEPVAPATGTPILTGS